MPRRIVAAVAIAVVAATLAAVPSLAAEQRVVGGQKTTIAEWPWQVAIADRPSTGGDGYDRQFCGGSLVAPTVVLTAAHCVYDNRFQRPGKFSVIAGRTTLSSSEGSEQPAIDLIYFVNSGGGPAPQSQTEPAAGSQLYDDIEWDVALIELPAAAPSPAAPIAIASAAERGLWEAGDPAFVTGWGSTLTAAGPYPDDLREAEVEIISDSDCGSVAAYGSAFHPETMVCAGIWPQGGKDTCQGDSGGPLVVPAGDGTYRLVGDTSWGFGCGLPLDPGVYGRVADDPMRSAIHAGIAFAQATPGAPGSPAADKRPPRTRIVKHPRNTTRKRMAKFRFASDEPGSRFECKLDGKRWKRCETPFRKRVRRGRHKLAVRAIDAAGNADPTPARDRWRVRRR